MANDSQLFRTAAQLAEDGWQREGTDWVKGRERYVPLYEAKMFSIYDHRSASYASRGDERGNRVLPSTKLEEHLDPTYEVEPFYWVPRVEVETALGRFQHKSMLVFNKVTGTSNERTFLPCFISVAGFGDSLNLLAIDLPPRLYPALYANCAAICLDYVVRRKVGGVNINFFHVQQLPILPPSFYTASILDFIVPRVLELTYTSHSLAPFARDLGYNGPPFAWDEDRRALLRAELDAFYARAYSLDRDELRYILDPADVKGPDYPSETFRVLKEKEIRHHGEYRTRRLVLEAWDRMEADGTFSGLDLSKD